MAAASIEIESEALMQDCSSVEAAVGPSRWRRVAGASTIIVLSLLVLGIVIRFRTELKETEIGNAIQETASSPTQVCDICEEMLLDPREADLFGPCSCYWCGKECAGEGNFGFHCFKPEEEESDPEIKSGKFQQCSKKRIDALAPYADVCYTCEDMKSDPYMMEELGGHCDCYWCGEECAGKDKYGFHCFSEKDKDDPEILNGKFQTCYTAGKPKPQGAQAVCHQCAEMKWDPIMKEETGPCNCYYCGEECAGKGSYGFHCFSHSEEKNDPEIKNGKFQPC